MLTFVWTEFHSLHCLCYVFLLLHVNNADENLLHNVSTVVGFTAWAQFSQSYEAGDLVLFDGITVNEGDFYSPSSGVFVCPTDGVYFINLNARRDDEEGNGAIFISAFKETEEVLRLYENDPSSEYNTVSSSALVDCQQGEFIFVEGTNSGTLYGKLGEAVSTFSVILLTEPTTLTLNDSYLGYSDVFDGYSGFLQQDVIYKTGDLLVMNGTVYNSSSYNPTTGNFTCQQTGIYYFTLNPQKVAAEDLSIGLSKETIMQYYLEEFAGENSGYNAISNSGLIYCQSGERLSVKAWLNGSAHAEFTSLTIMLMFSQNTPYHDSFVGFTAFKYDAQEYNRDDRITFEGIILDEGKGYDVGRNSFICPTYGLYFVSVNVKRFSNDPLDLKVQQETVTIVRVIDNYADNTANTISNSALFYCSMGHEVYISGGSEGSVDGDISRSFTTFTVLQIADSLA